MVLLVKVQKGIGVAAQRFELGKNGRTVPRGRSRNARSGIRPEIEGWFQGSDRRGRGWGLE